MKKIINQNTNYVRKIKNKIKKRLAIYALIKTLVDFTNPIVNFIGISAIIIVTYNLIQQATLLSHIVLITFLVLAIAIFVLSYFNKYLDLKQKKREEWIENIVEEAINKHYSQWDSQRREELKKNLIKSLSR